MSNNRYAARAYILARVVPLLCACPHRSAETHERRFGEFGHSKNLLGIPIIQEPWQVEFLVAHQISGNLEIPRIPLEALLV
jgi:hypothetical protein